MRSRRIWLALAAPATLAALVLAVPAAHTHRDGPVASVYNDNSPSQPVGTAIADNSSTSTPWPIWG
jgi:hypothetical protein